MEFCLSWSYADPYVPCASLSFYGVAGLCGIPQNATQVREQRPDVPHYRLHDLFHAASESFLVSDTTWMI